MGDPKGKVKAAQKVAMKEGTAPTKEEKFRGKKPEVKKPVVRNIIRVAGTDLDGNKQSAIALMKIRGVGYNFARAVLRVAAIDHKKKLMELSEDEIKKIEDIIEKPLDAGIPRWALNRQRDWATGADVHVTGSDLPITWRSDVELLKKIRAYRGIRHETGLPVRGQHTRTAGRKGVRVGVIRKKVMPAVKAAEKEKKK